MNNSHSKSKNRFRKEAIIVNEIKCTVENCVHHSKQNSCTAKEITVGKSVPQEKTCDCCETECDTFEAKE